MKYKYITGCLFLLSLVLIGVGYVLAKNPSLFGLCAPDYVGNCLDQNIKWGVGRALYDGLTFLPLLFLVLFFVRPDVFRLWWKFALPFFLFSLFFILPGDKPGGGGWAYSGPSRTESTYFFSLWLISSSLILFVLKTWQPKWRAYVIIPVAILVSLAGLIFAGVRTFFL